MRVHMYRNLNGGAGQVWSIRGTCGRVIGYCRTWQMDDAQANVRRSAYLDMQQRRERLVCAWFTGSLVGVQGFMPAGRHAADAQLEQEAACFESPLEPSRGVLARFHFGFDVPFESAGFFTYDGDRVTAAAEAWGDSRGRCWVEGVR